MCGSALETAFKLSSNESEPAGAANMWVPLLTFACHYETGAVFSECCDAQCLARLSQTCQFGMFLNPIPGDCGTPLAERRAAGCIDLCRKRGHGPRHWLPTGAIICKLSAARYLHRDERSLRRLQRGRFSAATHTCIRRPNLPLVARSPYGQHTLASAS